MVKLNHLFLIFYHHRYAKKLKRLYRKIQFYKQFLLPLFSSSKMSDIEFVKKLISSLPLSHDNLRELSIFCLAKRKELEKDMYVKYSIEFAGRIYDYRNDDELNDVRETILHPSHWHDYLYDAMCSAFFSKTIHMPNPIKEDIPIQSIHVELDEDEPQEKDQIIGRISWESLPIDAKFLKESIKFECNNIYNCYIEMDVRMTENIIGTNVNI